MTEGATSVSCLDETIQHKSSLAPDESIELPVLRNPSDAHTQEKQPEKVISTILAFNSRHTKKFIVTHIHSPKHAERNRVNQE